MEILLNAYVWISTVQQQGGDHILPPLDHPQDLVQVTILNLKQIIPIQPGHGHVLSNSTKNQFCQAQAKPQAQLGLSWL